MPTGTRAPSREREKTPHGVGQGRIQAVVNTITVFAGLLLLLVVFALTAPNFLTTNNIYRILQQVAVLSVVAVGQSLAIFTAGIDLSQAATVSLCGVLGATAMVSTHSVALGVVTGIGVGILVGIVNGLLIVKAGLVPFIATLAMLGIASGSALLTTGGQPVFGMPESFVNFGNNGLYVFPYIVMVSFVVAVIFQAMLSMTRIGRYIYAIGSNRFAAHSAGIRVGRVLVAVYAFSGLTAGVGSVMQIAYLDTAQPTLSMNLALNVIAVVIIGGGSLFGGEGSIWGTMSGALLIAVLNNGTELLGISTYVQTILLGIVVILAVTLDNLRRKERIAA